MLKLMRLSMDYNQNNLDVILGNKCNLNCTYCKDKKTYEVPELRSSSELLDTLSKFKYLEEVNFVGGEPLLYWDELADVISSLTGVKCTIITNGTLLDRSITRYLIDHRVGTAISCDGLDNSDRNYNIFEDRNKLYYANSLADNGLLKINSVISRDYDVLANANYLMSIIPNLNSWIMMPDYFSDNNYSITNLYKFLSSYKILRLARYVIKSYLDKSHSDYYVIDIDGNRLQSTYDHNRYSDTNNEGVRYNMRYKDYHAGGFLSYNFHKLMATSLSNLMVNTRNYTINRMLEDVLYYERS